MSKKYNQKFSDNVERRIAHKQAVAQNEVEEFYAREVHILPEIVREQIEHRDSKGRLNGYCYTANWHIGSSMFLKGSDSKVFGTHAVKVEDAYGKRVHVKYYK